MSDSEPFVAMAFAPLSFSLFLPLFPDSPKDAPLIFEHIVSSKAKCLIWVKHRRAEYKTILGISWVLLYPPILKPLSEAKKDFPNVEFQDWRDLVA